MSETRERNRPKASSHVVKIFKLKRQRGAAEGGRLREGDADDNNNRNPDRAACRGRSQPSLN